MGKIIEFKDTNFGYNSTSSFTDFNMSINEGDIVSLIGPSGSGKTTLLKMLCHQLPNDTCFYKGDSFPTVNIEILKREVVIVFDHPVKYSNIEQEIKRYLVLLGVSSEEINKRYEKVRKMFNLESIEKDDFETLPTTAQYLVKILRYLIINPSFIAIDSIYANLSKTDKTNIIKYVKENKMTLLNVVTDLNDTLYGNKVYVLDNFILILEGTTTSVLKTDTLLKRLGFSLPLPIDLSIELMHYDVLKKIYTDNEKLVGALWK